MTRPRAPRVLLAVWGGAVLVFLLLPILLILPISFSAGTFLSYPLPGLSLRWYRVIAEPFPWVFAFKNSLVVGVAATILSVVLGTMAAYGVTTAAFRFRTAVVVLLLSPMVVPVVISGLGIYFFLNRAGLLGSYTGLVIAHTALGIPFVVATVGATLQGFDRTLIRAAESLGGRPRAAFFDITLPIIMPGVVSGAIFAFVTSFDEVVVALFLSGTSAMTLPVQMWNGIRFEINPTVAAVSVILIVFTTVVFILFTTLKRASS